MRSTAAPVLVALLVALAGCGTAVPGTNSTPDATTAGDGTAEAATTASDDSGATTSTAATTTTTTARSTAAGTTTTSEAVDGDLPPGVNASGIVDAGTLWSAHTEVAYDGDGYEHVLALAGDAGNRTTIRLRASANASRALAAFENGTATEYAWFADGGNRSATWNTTSPERAYYERAGLSSVGPALVVAVAESYPAYVLRRVAVEPAGTVERDGRTYVRLRATGVAESETGGGVFEPSLPSDEYADANGTVLVSREGFVASMDLSLDPADGGTALSVTMNATRTAPAVEPPDWLGDAPALSTSVVERTDRGEPLLLAVENAGDVAVSTGATLSIGKTGFDFGNVTLSEPIAPGETAYVSLDGNSTFDADVEVAVGDRPTVAGDAPDFGSASGVVVTVVDGNVTAAVGLPENETTTAAAAAVASERAVAATPAVERAAGTALPQSSNARRVS
ncbi:hypothetical protein [Halorubellus litoreus]|uniref:Uncharacterized protein n=1 Tax=Halorubellus litoreus TaxID=755308 RepID=A0ABD5VA38_9EURY